MFCRFIDWNSNRTERFGIIFVHFVQCVYTLRLHKLIWNKKWFWLIWYILAKDYYSCIETKNSIRLYYFFNDELDAKLLIGLLNYFSHTSWILRIFSRPLASRYIRLGMNHSLLELRRCIFNFVFWTMKR